MTITPQTQLHLHDPDNGIWGDCARTCIAMLVGVPAAEVPHWNEPLDIGEQQIRHRAWLQERGLDMVAVSYSEGLGYTFDWLAEAMKAWNPGVPYMLSGTSPRGTCHVVIALDGKIIADPHPDNGGLVGPCNDNAWWISFIVSRPELVRVAA